MQLRHLVKTLDQMTEEELHEYLRQIRHRRTVERPAAKAREERVEKKESRVRISALDKLLASMTDSEREELIRKLETPNGAGSTS
jgi:hypothetical protein